MRQQLSAAFSDVALDVGGVVGTGSPASKASLQQVERGFRRRLADLLDQIAKALEVSAEVVDPDSSRRSEITAAANAIVTDVAMTRC
jgi:transcriptional regulator with XRE-family HTH domain